MTQTNLWFSFEKLPPEKKRVGHISGKWEMQNKWKYELIPCIPAIANKLTDSRWNLPPPQEMLMSSLHSNSNAGNHHDRYLHLYTFMGVFHQHFCFRSIIDIIDIDSWPNFIPLSKLCSGSTISAAESRCSCFFLTLAPKTCFWHTVGYGSILLRDMIYIYIQTYIHIYILNNEVANPVNSGLNIGYTILMYLICQTTVSNGGILLPHNWEKGLGRRKQYVGTSPGHRHWQCLEGLLFQRRQMIEAKHRDHPSLSTVTWRGSTPKCIHRPNRMCWQKPGS